MKNRFLFTLLFLGFFVSTNAQDSTRVCKFSLENQLIVIPGIDYVSLVYTRNKQQFFAGPVVSDDWSFFPGIHAGYRFFPWTMEKRFNWYLEGLALIQWHKHKFETERARASAYYGGIHTIVDRATQYGAIVGAGCRLNAGKRFYFSFTGDLILFQGYRGRSSLTYWDGREVNYDYEGSGAPTYFYDLFTATLGMGYKFCCRKHRNVEE